MDTRKCSGIEVSTGQPVEVTFDSAIRAVEPLLPPAEARTYVSAGWIDLQVNGFAGVDYCSAGASPEDIARSLHAQFATGVTRLFPTVITGSVDGMEAAIRNLALARAAIPEGRAMEGFHIEGPHISPEDGPRGAHPRHCVRPPDVEEFRRWMDVSDGQVKIVTVSPEWPGTNEYIESVVREGVVVSIGHTMATRQQIRDAVAAGATMSTHLGNGAHSELRRHPNYIWDQLAEDRLTASFIVDGIHLDESFLKVAMRAKGVERSVLITDAVMPAGCTPGLYRLGEVDVELHPDHRVTLVGQDKLAGSSLRMDRGVENLMRLAGLSLPEAITMASRNPARAGRISSRLRDLQPGERADIVEFAFVEAAKAIRVLRVFIDGVEVFSGDESTCAK